MGVRFKSKDIISDYNTSIIKELNKMKTFKKIKLYKGEIYICNYSTIISNLIKIFSKILGFGSKIKKWSKKLILKTK